jgi:hypothetical protein
MLNPDDEKTWRILECVTSKILWFVSVNSIPCNSFFMISLSFWTLRYIPEFPSTPSPYLKTFITVCKTCSIFSGSFKLSCINYSLSSSFYKILKNHRFSWQSSWSSLLRSKFIFGLFFLISSINAKSSFLETTISLTLLTISLAYGNNSKVIPS